MEGKKGRGRDGREREVRDVRGGKREGRKCRVPVTTFELLNHFVISAVVAEIVGVIGAIDGSHIPIKAPKKHHISYINRKGFHSILLQAVSDNNLLFTDCYAGEVGSVHDACMFRRSDLYSQMTSGTTIFPPGSHLIGDPAYPLMTTLLTPYKDDGRLTAQKNQFNRKLSAARSSIERAFALLKCRFRRLKYMDMTCTSLIPQCIIACCILHNMCIRCGDIVELEEGSDDDDDAVQHPTDGAVHSTSTVSSHRQAAAKRDTICHELSSRLH